MHAIGISNVHAYFGLCSICSMYSRILTILLEKLEGDRDGEEDVDERRPFMSFMFMFTCSDFGRYKFLVLLKVICHVGICTSYGKKKKKKKSKLT